MTDLAKNALQVRGALVQNGIRKTIRAEDLRLKCGLATHAELRDAIAECQRQGMRIDVGPGGPGTRLVCFR